MIKIPKNLQFSQPNNSDLFGNIWYTKSIDFDEDGYLKLSSRAVSILNSFTDNNFNTPVSYGRRTNGSFFIPTIEHNYILDILDGFSQISEDVYNGGDPHPDTDTSTFGKWWSNLWHITNNTKLYTKNNSSGNWTDTGVSLTTGVSHPIEVFEKSGTLMIGNGNLVKQVNSSYAVSTLAQLTLSTDFEIVGLAYNNNLMGIITRGSQTVTGQNREAEFFVWDGSLSSANSGFGVGSDSILAIAPYKSSFVILTREGQLLYFNGGGFDVIASFPVYFKDVIWGNSTFKMGYGDMIKVKGENIYININTELLDNNLNTYLENMLGGIWCYDKNIGLYHRYSPSISPATILCSQDSGVDITNNKITIYAAQSMPQSPTIPDTGNPIKVLNSTIDGIVQGGIYWIIKTSSTEFKLASSKENAMALIPVDLTSIGSSFSYFMTIKIQDYGQSRVYNAGGIGLMGYKTNSYNDLIFGGNYYSGVTSINALYSHLNITVSGFKNIGYFITAKILSDQIEDNFTKLYCKYGTLKTDDKIKVKYKNKDIVGIPEVAYCTASSNKIFTTTSNIINSYNYTDELECEIISGIGAGQMSKIESISFSNGTYTITLEDELDGINNGDFLAIKIDNWTYLTTIDNTTSENNYKEITLLKESKWTKFKIVLEGSETTIEELQIIGNIQIESV